MTTIVPPTPQQLAAEVETYLNAYPDQKLAFVIGYASPSFQNYGGIYYAGSVQNQFGGSLRLDEHTLFEIASISKTFTATLYALLVRFMDSTLTVNDFMAPAGPLSIGSQFGPITLDQLVNYTSGLPSDNAGGTDYPTYLPTPYSEAGMLSYLDSPEAPSVTDRGMTYTYSNLAFALMASILGWVRQGPPVLRAFDERMHEMVFKPLKMHDARYFDKAPIDRLVFGYNLSDGALTAAYPGWVYFPTYFGAGGIVASPKDMWHWLLFNMGIEQSDPLTSMLPMLQTPSTTVEWDGTQLCLSWFLTSASSGQSAALWKDGDLDGFNSYIAFLPSDAPGTTASQAGVFALVNADGLEGKGGGEVVATIANDLLLIMQGQAPPEDKSRYPMAALRRQRHGRSRS